MGLPKNRILANDRSHEFIMKFGPARMCPRWYDLACFEASVGKLLVTSEQQVLDSFDDWIRALSTKEGEFIILHSHFNQATQKEYNDAFAILAETMMREVKLLNRYRYKLGIRSVDSVQIGRCYVASPSPINKNYRPGCAEGNSVILNYMDFRIGGIEPMDINLFNRSDWGIIREYCNMGSKR